MFSDISYTLKVTAKIFWVLGICTIVGIVSFWPLAFVMYGLGELIEKMDQIEKNTRNGKSTSQINNECENAELLFNIKNAEKKTAYDEERIAMDQIEFVAEKMVYDILKSLPEEASEEFIDSIALARSSYTVGDAKKCINDALNTVTNPNEIDIMKRLMELPYSRFQSTLKQICKKYGR